MNFLVRISSAASARVCSSAASGFDRLGSSVPLNSRESSGHPLKDNRVTSCGALLSDAFISLIKYENKADFAIAHTLSTWLDLPSPTARDMLDEFLSPTQFAYVQLCALRGLDDAGKSPQNAENRAVIHDCSSASTALVRARWPSTFHLPWSSIGRTRMAHDWSTMATSK